MYNLEEDNKDHVLKIIHHQENYNLDLYLIIKKKNIMNKKNIL